MKPRPFGAAGAPHAVRQSVSNEGMARRIAPSPSVTFALTELPERPIESSGACCALNVRTPRSTPSILTRPSSSVVARASLPATVTMAFRSGVLRRLSYATPRTDTVGDWASARPDVVSTIAAAAAPAARQSRRGTGVLGDARRWTVVYAMVGHPCTPDRH